MSRYSFSGHESFQCKSLWLKKGYDFLLAGNRFTDEDAVTKLGVGKNMVASIRFWLRAFGLTRNDELMPIATYIFDSENGRDPFAEDIATLWILHFLLVTNCISSIYSLTFEELQREKKEFSKSELQNFIKRKCAVPEQKNVYNENTIRKDIGVLLKNYLAPSDLKSIEDFASLLIGLGLLVHKGNDTYRFREVDAKDVPNNIIIYSLIWLKGDDKTLSFDQLQRLSLIFCMPVSSLIEVIRKFETEYPQTLVFSDNSGIKNVHFLNDITWEQVLDKYYDAL